MARELTIQIRLTKEEHDTIAAQAGREGLGVGTYLRALALRNAFESSGTPRGRAFSALRRAPERAEAGRLGRLSPQEVGAGGEASRATRRGRGGGRRYKRS